MFATLLGPLPRPPLDDGAPAAALVEAAVLAQETAGLEPITDGGLPGDLTAIGPVAAWRRTAGLTTRVTKLAIEGPFTSGHGRGRHAVMERAAALNRTLRALVAEGCPFIEVHEPAAVTIGEDAAARALFRESQLRLLDGVVGTHLSLAITGGSADKAGVETILAAPYASLAVDLIAGPDNWRLVTRAPADRGIVCGALSPEPDAANEKEVLLWAAGYAAASGGRGPDRVGIASASSLAGLPWAEATDRMARLADVVRLATLPPEELLHEVDPRSIDARSAGLGRYEPHPPRPT